MLVSTHHLHPRTEVHLLLACFFSFLLGLSIAPLGTAATPNDPHLRVTPLSSNLFSLPHLGPGFTRIPHSTSGILFTNTLSPERSLTNHILMNGSGVAAGDIDGDGWCDLYLCGLDGPNALFRNLGGWKFTNITALAGVECRDMDSTGAVFADVDGDGDLDLLVSAINRGVTCFLNDGQGHFSDQTAALGLSSKMGSMTLALADIDGDGDLDLYVSNYRNETLRDGFRMQLRVGTVQGKKVVTMVNGQRLDTPQLEGWVTLDAQGNITENGQADTLYLNDGRGRFSPVSFTQGAFLDEEGRALTEAPHDWTLTAFFRDLNGDGKPDLYTCSDLASPDRIWINQGKGTFRAAASTLFRKTSWFSMGVDAGDLNRDGFDDLFITDMVSRDHVLRHVQVSNHQPVHSRVGEWNNRPQTPRNTLFVNTGDGEYLETAYFSRIDASDWSWAPVFLDVDLDGFEDILITTGFERDVQDIDIADELEAMRRQGNLSDADGLRIRSRFPRLALPNVAYRNNHDLTFQDVSHAWRFDSVGVAQGIALADLDRDGDLDVVINNMNDEVEILRNDATPPRVLVRLKGAKPNTMGIGARITVFDPSLPAQSQEIQSGGRYLSSDDAVRAFAIAPGTREIKVEVAWRSGSRSAFEQVPVPSILEISESTTTSSASQTNNAPSPPPAAPWFEDVSTQLNHRHEESEFDDFQRQPMLARKLSQSGPGMAWADIDSDGKEDLIVGAGRGGNLAMFRNNGKGGFDRIPLPPELAHCDQDLAGIVAFPVQGQALGILLAQSNLEADPGENRSSRLRWLHPSSAGFTNLNVGVEDVGPLALADVDGDGSMELFVGGRSAAGRYPSPAPSHLWKWKSNTWQEDASLQKLLAGLGHVNGAVFTDLEGDGFPELVVTTDWGPIRIFRNQQGRFEPWDLPMTGSGQAPCTAGGHTLTRLSQCTGLWSGVAAGDFNGDGRLDLLVGNSGRNLRQETYRSFPLRLYYGDLNDSGTFDLLETYYEPSMKLYVPWMHLGRVRPVIPSIAARFARFRDFGQAGIEDILGERRERMQIAEVVWTETTLFLNRAQGLEVHPLDSKAQWSPAWGVAIADFNGDGREDAFLSQNLFSVDPEMSRLDAGRGLCLQGDGRGGLQPMSAGMSGVRVYGEQRAAAVCDYDHDGRVDLVVAQNGGVTKLFRNQSAAPGLRVQLQGPEGNPAGIGAVMRIVYQGGGFGPAREIHAGSGYWSQDAWVQVLGISGKPSALEVRWPGGKTSSYPLQEGDRTIAASWKNPHLP